MPYTDATLRLVAPDGQLVHTDRNEIYHQAIAHLTEAELLEFYRVMTVVRRFDVEAGNLQRQGQMALWVPSIGQEAAQVGSGFATRPQDNIFPAYREHSVAYLKGLDLLDIIRMLRGITNGGWDPKTSQNFHLYTLVIGSHTLHATGYAMGIGFDGKCGSGDLDSDEAVLVYFGDGATSQGDTNEAMILPRVTKRRRSFSCRTITGRFLSLCGFNPEHHCLSAQQASVFRVFKSMAMMC